MPRTIFDSTSEFLKDLLDEARVGKLQLPDFQRGWVWDDYGIRSVIASLSQSFPIGAVMLLQNGGEVRFRPRPIEGVDEVLQDRQPDRLILDGQQRLTSLFQACCTSDPVLTRNDKGQTVYRHYYFDMTMAVDPNVEREDAVISVPANGIITRNFGREIELDVSSREKEYEQFMFPINCVFDMDAWEDGYQEYWDFDRDRLRFLKDFKNDIVEAFKQYQLPVISLRRETTKEAVCLVFEKVNTGGKKLDAFELLTAIYAADGYNLRDDWLGNRKENLEGRLTRLSRFNVLKETASTDFLQAVSLLHTADLRKEADDKGVTNPKELPSVSCNRKTLLNLPLKAYRRYADSVEEAFTRAGKFLTLQKVFWYKDIPYDTQIVPLAAILVRLGDRWDEQGVREKLSRWYWCGVFGELYGSATETRFARDFTEVLPWIDGGPEPSTVQEAGFAPNRLQTLRSRQSAAYKGINALLKKKGGYDLRSGEPIEYSTFWQENIDIHHIFPQKWCKKRDIDRNLYDSIINKTPLSQRTNRIIGGNAPSSYLEMLKRDAGISDEVLNQSLRSHAIDPDSLGNDDFHGFMARRSRALLDWISDAMGKDIPRSEIQYEGEDAGETQEEVIESLEEEDPAV